MIQPYNQNEDFHFSLYKILIIFKKFANFPFANLIHFHYMSEILLSMLFQSSLIFSKKEILLNLRIIY